MPAASSSHARLVSPCSPSLPLPPVFSRAAEELGASVFVHPWDMMGSDMPGMKKYFLPWLVGMPAETTFAVASMMFAGVFER